MTSASGDHAGKHSERMAKKADCTAWSEAQCCSYMWMAAGSWMCVGVRHAGSTSQTSLTSPTQQASVSRAPRQDNLRRPSCPIKHPFFFPLSLDLYRVHYREHLFHRLSPRSSSSARSSNYPILEPRTRRSCRLATQAPLQTLTPKSATSTSTATVASQLSTV